MALTEHLLDGDIHPIDLVESVAEYNEWDFDRIADDQIAMAADADFYIFFEGQWRTYSITLAWSSFDETLRLICSFEMEPPSEKQAILFELLNDVNEKCWAGSFSFWTEQKMMIYKYGLVLTGGQIASVEQVDCLISTAVLSSEKFYPAFQLAVYGDKSPKEAIQVAIAEAFGRA